MYKKLALALFAAAVAASDVTQLTKDTFDTFVAENPLVLAECECCVIPPIRRWTWT
jgi:hypothetical protein